MALADAIKSGNRLASDPFDLDRLSSPQVFVASMVIFLAITAFVAAILYRQISTAFAANPGLNALIIGVLVIGILLAFLQVIRLFREVSWVNAVRSGSAADNTSEPVLLAPMKALFIRQKANALSTTTMRSILDSIATRLDEARDISRYLTGLLVFLGLLGTFWGLLETISSIGDTIATLDPQGGDANAMLASLKSGLAAPLAGMATAFSSSLLGLSGSLILGFLDLQAGRAQNRFYVELENWLSSITDPDQDTGTTSQVRPALNDDMRQLSERLKAVADANGGANQKSTAALANLAEGIQGLVTNMRSEQQMMRDWVESQAAEHKELRSTLDKLSKTLTEKKG